MSINFSPRYALAYNNRGDVYYKLGNNQQAIQDYNQTINFFPNYTFAYINRGNAYYQLKNFQLTI
ncbi:MAG: tetratricopeptide repeat protein [Calothrix sp. FI2-JRJ7]|nr:tetratricopeptide repeat protein [Calothrix sp. FI2-JRJ7]